MPDKARFCPEAPGAESSGQKISNLLRDPLSSTVYGKTPPWYRPTHSYFEPLSRRKTQIAAAVAGALACSFAIADGTVSGSIRAGVEYDGNDWRVVDNDSRLRFQASSGIANGQSVYMNYEFRVDSAQGSIVTGDNEHLSFIGIKGDWGSLSLGAQWSTTFNTVGTFIDKSFRYGGAALECVQYRMTNAVMLSTQLDLLTLMADAQMNANGDSLDRATVGGLVSAGRISFAAMYQSADDNCLGVAGAITLGALELAGGFIGRERGSEGWDVNGSIQNLWVDLSSSDNGGDAIVVSYTMKFRSGSELVLEGSETPIRTRAGAFLRYDF
ncbi:MAG: porin [Gammaproteobacteria bacterium]|nr:porin [Gammaproteobacteria bacterium]